MILVDTNLLARMTDSVNPHCVSARAAVHRLFLHQERVCIVPQNLYEFWAVATRNPGGGPTGQNGLGMSTDRAAQWVAFFRRRFTLLPDRKDLPTR